jgi:hypothetical protein
LHVFELCFIFKKPVSHLYIMIFACFLVTRSLWIAHALSHLYTHFSSVAKKWKIWSVVDLLSQNPHWWS